MAFQLNEADMRAAVSEISTEVIIHKLTDLDAEISKSLSNLSEELVKEVNLMNQIRTTIEIENEQLQKLHKMDVAATALDQSHACKINLKRQKKKLKKSLKKRLRGRQVLERSHISIRLRWNKRRIAQQQVLNHE